MKLHSLSPIPRSLNFNFPLQKFSQSSPMATSHKSKLNFRPEDDRRRCKRHPKHRQSPGVCSLCLIEKLSNLSAAVSRKTSESLSSSSSSSYYSSPSSCSSCSSPNLYSYSMDRRKAAPIISSSIFKKSKSLAFAPRFRRRREEDSGKRSNLGFWSKLIFLSRPRRKRTIMEEVEN